MTLLKRLLALYCAEGFLTVLWIFFTPSEGRSAVILWLSRERVVLLTAALLLWVLLMAGGIASWRSPAVAEAIKSWLDRFCLEEGRLGSLLISIVLISLSVLAATIKVIRTPLEYAAYRGWAPDTFPLLHSLVEALLPFLLLGILIAVEFAVYLVIQYRAAVSDPAFWSWAQIGPALIFLISSLLTIFYWLVLVFQLHFFVNNPAWYWKFAAVPFSRGDLWYALGTLLLLTLAYWTLVRRRRLLAGLLVLFALGVFLQFGVGLMSGGGLAAFRDRYFSTYHKTYISKATQGQVALVQGTRQYEQLFGSRAFTSTKPPGLMVFYMAVDHLISGHPSAYPDAVRYERLASLVAYGFPLLAMLMVFAIYAFARRFIQAPAGLVRFLAPFLLILCPNLVLFSLFPDQAIYPLLFLIGASFIIVAIQRQSLMLAFALGLFLYIAVFFAFTMLPLYPFAGIYLALSYWANRRDRSLRQQLWIALAIAAGSVLLYFLFRVLLNYDFLPRFAKTIAINHNFDFYLRVGQKPPTGPESFFTRVSQTLGAIWLNNLDFAAAVGFPIYILFAVQSVRLLRRFFKGLIDSGDIILASLLLSFILLNLAGTAQGEVPRLWLFWLPMVVLLAAREIEPFVQAHPMVLPWLAITQFITIFLTFHFQDLRM